MPGLFAYFTRVPRTTGLRRLALWLAILFVFTIPWENALQIANVGRASKLVGFVTFAVWALSLLGRGRLRQPDAFQKAFLLFLIWNGFTLFWSVDTAATTSGFRTYTELFLLILLLWDLMDNEAAVKAALQAYVLGAYVACGSIIVKYATAPAPRFPAFDRINALGYQTDGIALIVAIALPAAWYLAGHPDGHERSPTASVLNYLYMPVGLLALVMTGTRGATLASIPTAIFILWSVRHADRARRLMATTAIVATGVLLVELAPAGQLERIRTATTVTELGGGALGGRWTIWQNSIRVLRDRPLIGVGLDAHRAATAPLRGRTVVYRKADKEAHNTYISVLAETGVVGLALFIAVILGVIARVLPRRGRDRAYWFAQLSVLAIGGMSLSLEDSKSVWIFMSLAVASAAAARTAAAPVPAARDTARPRRRGTAQPVLTPSP